MKVIKVLKRKLKGSLKRELQEEKERSIILDTSALESKEVMQVIQKATKVILLCGTIDEMDKYKEENSLFGANIREISRRSREDKKSEKYICVAGYERHRYNDKNIIDYCILHKKTIILTSDNNLCNYAKAYGIHYIYLEKKQKKQEKQEQKHEKQEQEKQKQENQKQKKQPEIIRQQVKHVIYKEGKLYFNTKKINKKFILYRKEELLDITSKENVELEVGDIIYEISVNKENMSIAEHEIQVIAKNNYAYCKRKELVKPCEDYTDKKNSFPEEVINRISEILNSENDKEIAQLEEIKTDQEVYFYKNWIEVKKCKDYDTKTILEREGNIIKLQDYQEGDYLYVLRKNKSNRYVEITIYEIVLKENKYMAKEIEKQRAYYVNEIFRLNFSEEIKDAICKLLIANSKY